MKMEPYWRIVHVASRYRWFVRSIPRTPWQFEWWLGEFGASDGTYRKDNEYAVRVELPGGNPSDVNVHTEANLLTITGERKGEEKGPEYRETFYGKFERQIALPQA